MPRTASRGLAVLSVNRMFYAALAPELERQDFDVLLAPELGPDVPYVEVVHCSDDHPETWSVLRSSNDLNRVGYVVLVDELTPDNLRRALTRGAAAIAIDTDPAAVVDVIIRRYLGQICAPAGLLVALAAHPADTLTVSERTVLQLAVAGQTLERIAEQMHFSDRHVRRILRSVLAKAGTDSRAAAAEYFKAELEA